MKQIKFINILLSMLLTVMFTGCLSDGDETVSLEYGNHDERLDNVVPEELQAAIGKYMPIYYGENPPLIEGAYYMSPLVAVYCEDGGFEPGEKASPLTIRFSNQNTVNNTLDIAGYDDNDSSGAGTGAFISGNGNNFTAFFNINGVDNGISIKMAMVISGTKTSNGIKDLCFASLMVKKGSDPNHKLMDEGVFRVFKDGDGLSENTSWNKTRSLEDYTTMPEWIIHSIIR